MTLREQVQALEQQLERERERHRETSETVCRRAARRGESARLARLALRALLSQCERMTGYDEVSTDDWDELADVASAAEEALTRSLELEVAEDG